MQLTQKETSLLKDLKTQEKLCVQKYSKHAQTAIDDQLRDLFNEIASIEQHHLEMLQQIESGAVPQTKQGGSNQQAKTFTAKYGIGETPEKSADCYLCNDLLAAEKHASALYDTSIFEFSQQDLRNVLNEIQKDEQYHGKQLYDYMSANSMQG